MTGILSYIPSPSDGVLHLGPVPLHMYGLMLAIGVIVAAKLGDKRATARGMKEGTVGEIATVIVIAGVVGARVYHLFTGYHWDRDGIAGTIQIWKGGLSIWGAVLGGALGLIWQARRHHLDAVVLMDALGPAVAVAQAIGRFGNWFNQELFGRPTTLPWGLEISCAKATAVGYPCAPGQTFRTFHPAFLYEAIWCVLIFLFVTWAEKRFQWRRGQSVAAYISLYTFERFWMELLRVDDATRVFGVRFNALLSAVICVLATAAFVRFGRRAETSPEPASETTAPAP